MKIKLSEIKGSTPRVRTTQSPEALDELAASIKETGGVIVPIKVQKNGSGYTTVYGHRRVAAAKQAGLEEIDAIVVDELDDGNLQTQALIENVVREDMAAIDIAKALKQIKDETGWTNEKIGARFGHNDAWVSRNLNLLKDTFRKIAEDSSSTKVTVEHLDQARAGTQDDDDAARVLKKAAEENLSTRQTRAVAEEYRRAKEFGGEKVAKRVLEEPYKPDYEKQADEILRKGRAERPSATKPKGEVLFQWIKDERVILAEEGLKALSACVAAINLEKRDRGMGKKILQKLRKRTQTVLDQIDEILEGFDA